MFIVTETEIQLTQFDIRLPDRITQRPEVMGGKACVRGMRVTLAEIPARVTDEPRWVLIGKIDQKHWSAVARRGSSLAGSIATPPVDRIEGATITSKKIAG
jgi:hypothetical protein